MPDVPPPPIRTSPQSISQGQSTGRNTPSPKLRNRPLDRAATFADSSTLKAPRRSSLLSDYSLDEARQSFRSSTDDLLLPKPSRLGAGDSQETSSWHSAPLAFALLPAVGGLLFKNGVAVVTDVMLLGLAAIFLNWSVRLPWDWYHSSQSVRLRQPRPTQENAEETDEDDNEGNAVSPSFDGADPAPSLPIKSSEDTNNDDEVRGSAASELHYHEYLALFSCFLSPLLGAYLLHALRSQLSRPSEGLVSNYNLTIFLLAAEIRPVSHLVRLIQARTLFLQRIVNNNPYEDVSEQGNIEDLQKRLEALEARTAIDNVANSSDSKGTKPSVSITAEVRRGLQPDLDALNRAVRRYEKRATLQTMQNESRLRDLESRLQDALSLAAAAAHSGQNQRPGFASILVEWICAAVVLPLQASWAFINLPAQVAARLIAYTTSTAANGSSKKDRRAAAGRSHGRGAGDRVPGRLAKKI
ncbi:MAG: hypothetical protein M1825_000985 [Sarcosagium campestre]|nr:MAG: hypothetical protein M1825_000985 [Sarcosagium campestre]